MSVLVTVGVAVEDVPFGEAFRTDPDRSVRLERVVPLGAATIPYIWTKGSVESLEAALRRETAVASFRIVDTIDDRTLVRVEWARDDDGFFALMRESDATIVQGEGNADGWTFKLRFDDREEFAACYRRGIDRGIGLDIQRINNPGVAMDEEPGFGITDEQREALELALERGYFDVPRQTTLTELANDLEVSDTATSQRIRRGLSTLLDRTLESSESRYASR